MEKDLGYISLLRHIHSQDMVLFQGRHALNIENTVKFFMRGQIIHEKKQPLFSERVKSDIFVALMLFILAGSIPLLVSPITALKPENSLISGNETILNGSQPILQMIMPPSLPQTSNPINTSSMSELLVNGSKETTHKCTNCTNSSERYTSWDKMPRISQDEETEKIAALNRNITREGRGWVAGHTSVSNLTPKAFNQLLGFELSSELNNTSVSNVSIETVDEVSISSLPSSFTWRDNGGDYTTPVRNQGSCGSCWAFASTAVFESFYERLYQDPSLNPDFSEQYLVSCSDVGSCSGGYSAIRYFIDESGGGAVGTVQESVFPYTATDASCINLNAYTRYKAPSGTFSSGATFPSASLLKGYLYTYGPLLISLGVDSAFSAYTGGIYSSSYSGEVNHAVLLVGWGTTNSGLTYWICKNSWGSGWGESGYFRILDGSNKFGTYIAYMGYSSLTKPTVSAITPSSGTTGTTILITNLSGSNFYTDSQITLTRSGYSTIAATGEALSSTTKLTGKIDLSGSAPGSWNVVVTNSDGTTGTFTNGFTVLPNISARFFGVPGTVVYPYTVQFFDVSEGNPVSRIWNFGDGNTSTEKNVSHTYTKTGNSTVTLTVYDGYGSSLATT
jgi:C1A family cysteine protease